MQANGSRAGVVVLAWCCLAWGSAAIAQDEALKKFLKESMSQYSGTVVLDGPEEPEFEDVLYQWAKAGDGLATLDSRTAKRYRLPPAVAARLVELTLERGALDSDKGKPPAMVAKYVALARENPGADLALVEAARVVDDGSYGDCNVADFERFLAGRPDADAARLRIFDTVWCLPLLTERTSLRAGDTAPYMDLALRSSEISSEWLRLAVLRIADEKASRDPAIAQAQRVDVRRRLIDAELQQGRLAEALALLPAAPGERPELLTSLSRMQRGAIAAAYLLRGDQAHARAWLATTGGREGAIAGKGSYEQREWESRNWAMDLVDHALDPGKRDDFLFLTRWFGFSGSSPAPVGLWKTLFERVALGQGYPGMASEPYEVDVAQERAEAVKACYRCAAELAAMVESVAAAHPKPAAFVHDFGPSLPAAVLERVQRVMASPRPAWSEHALAAGLRTDRKPPPSPADDKEIVFRLAENAREKQAPAWAARLPEGTLVRYATQARRLVAITASQGLDPTGEVSAGGYWISVSEDGGAHFARPLYAGLRMFEPYVLLPDSKLPMLEGDRVRIEVAVRKLDGEHVSLPPVSIPFLDQRDDLYLEASFDELARDSDRDGLSDLAEWGMLLAPDLADTDGDGIVDGSDPLPHIAATDRIVGADAMVAGLNRIFGASLGAIVTSSATDSHPGQSYMAGPDTDSFDAAGTHFLAAPPAYFAGLTLKSRVIVLDHAMLERLTSARGLSFATGIRNFEVSHDGNSAVMCWSMGWAGGAMVLRRKGKDWEIEELSSWIT